MQLFTNIENELVKRIEEATENLKIAVTWFTNHDIFNAILKKQKLAGFKVDLIVLNDRINNKQVGLDFQKFIDGGGNFYYSETKNMVHHKFCIVDNKLVITGSYNWTYYAENRNWENVILLTDATTVSAYMNEFSNVISKHEKVIDVSSVRRLETFMDAGSYLQTDYSYQAKKEVQKGNDLIAAKIYTEVLKLNPKDESAVVNRTEIERKYNKDFFEVSPFEIGVLYKEGYVMAIPAFEKLPFTAVKRALTTFDKQPSMNVEIQKNDGIVKTILKFSFKLLKPEPMGTVKAEYQIYLEQSGLLRVTVQEVNGYNINTNVVKKLNLKDCLK